MDGLKRRETLISARCKAPTVSNKDVRILIMYKYQKSI